MWWPVRLIGDLGHGSGRPWLYTLCRCILTSKWAAVLWAFTIAGDGPLQTLFSQATTHEQTYYIYSPTAADATVSTRLPSYLILIVLLPYLSFEDQHTNRSRKAQVSSSYPLHTNCLDSAFSCSLFFAMEIFHWISVIRLQSMYFSPTINAVW